MMPSPPNFPWLRLVGLAALLFTSASAWAADCRLESVVCKEGLASDSRYVAGKTTVMPCKTIGGDSICLTDIGQTCWGNRKTYTCIKPNSVNYCQPFVDAQPQCWQTGSQCSQMDTLFNSGCMRHLQTWRCNDPAMPTPGNTLRLSDTYTLLSSDYDPGPCQSQDNNPNCLIAESQCVSTSPDTPLPPGIDPSQVAPDDCYRKQNTYACLTGRTDSSECDGYAANPDCEKQSSRCMDDADDDVINGQCLYEEQTYRCLSKPPQTNTAIDCSGQMFCLNGDCFDTGYTNDTDFALTMGYLEAMREAGEYGEFDEASSSIFSGVSSKCAIKLFGLSNCCKKSSGGGGMSNNAMLGGAKDVGRYALNYGSKYMYDTLYTTDAPGWIMDGLEALSGTITDTSCLASPSLSFGFYGFTVTAGAIGSGSIALGSVGGLNFAFDPTSFAIQIAIMVIQEMMKCDQDEQILAMRLGQNLCHKVGTYCSKKIKFLVKICIEHKQSYCCYNSRLARIINEQGRAQIGKGWGSAESPNCSGFTMDEFAALDFSAMDLSEFTAEILANIRMPDISGIAENVQESVQQKLLNYYGQGSQ